MTNLSGKILGNRYILLEKVGEGGMALVYKARCQLLNRYVAIKILRPEFTADEEFVKKFKRESMAAASISHPNIVGIYDVGEQDGIYYIVMEYIHGQTLKDYIKAKGSLHYTETIKIITQISYALDHAHRNGVVHRDIKPHNILITDEKIIKVTDFGIARASSTVTMTNTGAVMGSVHYFSPEQARGGYSDHRTDIYSLGVVMYEMLTGRLPYDAESPVTIALKHIQDSFVEPIEANHEVPKALNDIVIKAMQKDMTKRYQSVKELIDDLNMAQSSPDTKLYDWHIDNESTKVIPVEEINDALEKSRKQKKSHKGLKITIGILVFLILAGAFGVFAFNKWFVVKDVKIPPIVGLTEEKAREMLEKVGLAMERAEVSDNSEAGRVVKVYPEEGTTVKENSIVNVLVSVGPQKVNVPDLKNYDVISAETALKKAGLKLGYTDTKNSDEVQKDLIIEQEPKAGEQVLKDSAVNIVISSGPELQFVNVPVLIGHTLNEAQELLLSNKLNIGPISYGTDPKYVDGVVIYQDVPAGTPVKEGYVINVTLNVLDVEQDNSGND